MKKTVVQAKPARKAPPSLDQSVFKISEVAVLLHCGDRVVRNMIDRGELPVIAFGRVIRVPGDAVRALLSGGRKPVVSEAASTPKRKIGSR